MSTDMHLELAALDARLRGANLGRDLHAPQELFAFVDTVPETHRPAPRVELVLGDHVRLRRSVFGLVAAAAVVAAIVGSALLMSIRNGQPAAPSDPHAPVIPGWTWLRADGTKTFMIFRVGNGYLSEPCGEVQTSLPPTCSSADALHWTMPASAAVAGSWDPEPAGILRTLSNHGKTYLATGYYVEAAPPQTCENPPDCTKSAVWRSTDGVHWKGIDLGVNPPWSSIYAFPSGFVSMGDDTEVATSADGVRWTPGAPVPYRQRHTKGMRSISGLGIFVGSIDELPREAFWTADGTKWTAMRLPDDTDGVPSLVFQAPDGRLLGLIDLHGGNSRTIVSSRDGATWTDERGTLPGTPTFFAEARGSLFVTVEGGGIWRSADSGKTWTRVLDGLGKPVAGEARCLEWPPAGAECERLSIYDNGLTWVAAPS